MGSSLHMSTGAARSLLQCGLSMGLQPLLGIHLLRCGVLHGLQVDICSTMDLHGLQGHNLPHHGIYHGLQGKLCFGAWSISSPSFFTDLGVCRVVSLTSSHFFLMTAFSPRFFSPSYIRYSRGTTTITDGLGLGQWQVHLGGIWHWLYRTAGKLPAASHITHPYTPCAIKTLPRNLVTHIPSCLLARTCHNLFNSLSGTHFPVSLTLQLCLPIARLCVNKGKGHAGSGSSVKTDW